MPNPLRDLYKRDDTSFDYIFEENVSIPLFTKGCVIRCNVYRPKNEQNTYPVLVTYGPYGKDIHYGNFHEQSFSDVPQEHHSPHSAWETPDPGFWTKEGYAVVRGDEIGTGQSPGFLDTMSHDTAAAFAHLIEWTAVQSWSSGKVGLLGISYFAGSQWRVAARQPKGLACIIPWEGMSDYYRDRCRHGGILSNTFIDWWWNRQVVSNQYGRPGRAARNWGPDTLEGDLSEIELQANRNDQTIDNSQHQFLDEDYYESKSFDLSNVKVPLLSVANWGAILLHLRGNVEGFMYAGSQQKFIRFITGRHDLPFYLEQNVQLQKSFLAAFLKDDDRDGWTTGQVPRVGLVLRKGDLGYNDFEAEKRLPQRYENEWPIARTIYTKFHLTPSCELKEGTQFFPDSKETVVSYKSPGSVTSPESVAFSTASFTQETEITGHVVARLSVSVTKREQALRANPSEIDLFLTLRHFDANDKEIHYTGAVGDPVPVSKGWLRVSLRATAEGHPMDQPWHPYRQYRSTDYRTVVPGEIYEVDVEIWPTNVVVAPGNRLVLEVSSGDTQGVGTLFLHNSETDRASEKLWGWNHIHFGPQRDNWLMLPIIPAQQ